MSKDAALILALGLLASTMIYACAFRYSPCGQNVIKRHLVIDHWTGKIDVRDD